MVDGKPEDDAFVRLSDTISELSISRSNYSPCQMSLPNITFEWVDHATHSRVTSWIQLLPNMNSDNMTFKIEKGGRAIRVTYEWPGFFDSALAIPMSFTNSQGSSLFPRTHSKMIALETYKKVSKEKFKNYGKSEMIIPLPIACEEQFTSTLGYPGVDLILHEVKHRDVVIAEYPILHMELMAVRSNYVISSPTLQFRRNSARSATQARSGKRSKVIDEDEAVPMTTDEKAV